MEDFIIIDIEEGNHNFTVEIEFVITRKRRRFGFPYNEGWCDAAKPGEIPKIIQHITKIIEKEENNTNELSSLNNLKNSYKNKIVYKKDDMINTKEA